jgi:hypothetical protein
MKEIATVEVDVNYYLVLNPMMGNAENTQQFGPFESKDAVVSFYQSELVEPYEGKGPDMFGEGQKKYQKTFREGGDLEWMNPLYNIDEIDMHHHGIHRMYGDIIKETGSRLET